MHDDRVRPLARAKRSIAVITCSGARKEIMLFAFGRLRRGNESRCAVGCRGRDEGHVYDLEQRGPNRWP